MDARPLITVQGLDDVDMATDQSSTVVSTDVITALARLDIGHAQISNNCALSRTPPVGVANLEEKLGKLVLTSEVYRKNKEKNITKVEGLEELHSANQRKEDPRQRRLALRLLDVGKKNPLKNLNEMLKLNPDAKPAKRMSLLAEAQRVKAKKEKLAEKRKPVTKDDDDVLSIEAAWDSLYKIWISLKIPLNLNIQDLN